MSYEQLTGADYLATFVAENARFISAAQVSGFNAPVASCPGWNVGDLVFHVGKVQRWFHYMLETNGADPKGSPRAAKPETDASMVEWFREGAEVIESYLAGVSDTEPVWSFTGGDAGRWAKRRQAQELLVHRFDAELAGGPVSAADATMCADGVDELLTIFVPRLKDKAQLTGTIHFHCTDTNGEWMLTPQETGIEVTREHGKGDVALRAPAHVLLQVVWRRMSVDEAIASGAEVFGNRGALDAFIDLSQF
ncbi:MAG: maleylpyruvate isomerase family mycothiol-dependent enzyme [Ilumatobacteraceae bacterium]|nr:maleylpyruvate isomerase family mycothiol-dependent enzyme [Ilumatobacteraceae bacterium]